MYRTDCRLLQSFGTKDRKVYTLRYNRLTSFLNLFIQMQPRENMNKTHILQRQVTKLPFSLLVLFVLVWFTYGILFKAPYSGISFGTSNGEVTNIFIKQEWEPRLKEGDILKTVNGISWETYKKNGWLSFFSGVEKGDLVKVEVMQGNGKLTIPWRFPGFNTAEFYGRFFNIWVLAYIFWFAGSVVELSVRPRDIRRSLFIAASYLTALWLILGSLSATHIFGSPILLRAITWLLLPVYLHLHWVFPLPFRELPRPLWILFYAVCFSLAVAEMFQLPPKSLYYTAFLVALAGSLLLEVLHFVKQSSQRRDILLLAASLLVATIPSIGLTILSMYKMMPYLGPAAFFSLPLMPLSYFYIIYRRRLGGLEVRINRIISLYGFLIVIGIATGLLAVFLVSLKLDDESWMFLGTILVLGAGVISAVGFPAFEKFVDRRFFGIKLPYQNLQETYSDRITTSTSLSALLQLLEDEVFPSLLVRQYAFMQFPGSESKVLLSKNVPADQLSHEAGMEELSAQSGKYLPEDIVNSNWKRLILPLRADDCVIGFWLLGQRDPDDYYSQAELPILQSLANQTAIALSNILRAEQLRKMYQADIERYEKERMRLALELHDSVLNELAILHTNLDEANLSPQIQSSYEEVTHRLREIVSDLRPPMLMYGLIPAINALADNIMERTGDKITVTVEIRADEEERLPQNIEQHLFRIAQEACENSQRHAQANNINITGRLTSREVELNIIDNGAGFEPQTALDNLIASQHFGLAGMVERVNLIGAEINIQSTPRVGTKIHIRWAGESEKS
jgi:signal transduction histidine kinase